MPKSSDQHGNASTLLLVILAAVGIALGGYKLLGSATAYLAGHLPDRLEVNIFGGLEQPGWVLQAQSSDERRAAAVFESLRKQPKLRDLEYKLHFVSEETPNAYAIPGGSIGITHGLLDIIQGDIGLAMVIAHEFGHHHHRHALQRMGQSLFLTGLLLLATGGEDSIFINFALDLAQNSYSRSHEFEADAYGMAMVHKTFGTTAGAFEFFEKIQQVSPTDNDETFAMFSTHPYTPDRIERLKTLAKRLEQQAPTP